MQHLASVDRSTAPPLFLGLTYPGDRWDDSPEIWHEHLEMFWKRILRRWPNAKPSLFWRLEPQERGAPHFHLLVFGIPFMHYRWVGREWADITGGNADTCSRVEKVRSWRGAMAYAGKYLGKLDDSRSFTTDAGEELPDVGRHWGIKGRKNLPVQWVCYLLEQGEFFDIRRQLGRYVRSKGRRHRVRARLAGVWCFMQGEDAIRLLGGFAPHAEMLWESPSL